MVWAKNPSREGVQPFMRGHLGKWIDPWTAYYNWSDFIDPQIERPEGASRPTPKENQS